MKTLYYTKLGRREARNTQKFQINSVLKGVELGRGVLKMTATNSIFKISVCYFNPNGAL